MPNDVHERLIRLREVMDRTSMKRSSVYEMARTGKFPRPVHLGRTTAWPESEINQWIAERMASRLTGSTDQ